MYFHQKIIRRKSFLVRTLPFFEKITEKYTRKSSSGNRLNGEKPEKHEKSVHFHRKSGNRNTKLEILLITVNELIVVID